MGESEYFLMERIIFVIRFGDFTLNNLFWRSSGSLSPVLPADELQKYLIIEFLE